MPITISSYAPVAFARLAADPPKAGAPAWISYAAFALSVLVATIGLSTFVRTYLRDRRRDVREHAEKVAAWTGPDVGEGQDGYRFRSVVVNNRSDQPVYNAVVVLRTAEPGGRPTGATW